jgi:KUP system potassium uptake protein
MNPPPAKAVPPALVIGAVGVVFGDVGTSPLYALRAVFAAGLDPSALADVLGVLSLIFWSIAFVVGVKYVSIVLRADNEGEGGVLALTQLAIASADARRARLLALMGLAGCALFFGDGVITPAISVLSAVEGLELLAPDLESLVVPVSLGILVSLFLIQKNGTTRISRAFGPVMIVWFATLALLGAASIAKTPAVLAAVDPRYALAMLQTHPLLALAIGGAVFLCVTGGEALYADLGHFGRRAIARGWMLVVWPALVINYFGQGALLLRDGAALENPFFLLAPREWLFSMVLLATCATVIASQAVISGVFSIARQCQHLGYLPRMRVVHSSEHSIGQVYVPFINWMLCLFTLLLVVGFGSSGALAGAYGVGVSITMTLDSLLMLALLAATRPPYRAAQGLLIGLVLLFEIFFVAGNVQKLDAGGWVPLLFGSSILLLMLTWRAGREAVAARTSREDYTPAQFRALVERLQPAVVDKTVVFLASDPDLIPRTLVRNLQVNRVLHSQTLVMTVSTAAVPRVALGSRTRVQELAPGIYRIVCTVGFMDRIDVPALLQESRRLFKEIDLKGVVYVLGRDDVVTSGRTTLSAPQKALFAFMSRNAEFAGSHLGIAADRIVESGGQVAI